MRQWLLMHAARFSSNAHQSLLQALQAGTTGGLTFFLDASSSCTSRWCMPAQAVLAILSSVGASTACSTASATCRAKPVMAARCCCCAAGDAEPAEQLLALFRDCSVVQAGLQHGLTACSAAGTWLPAAARVAAQETRQAGCANSTCRAHQRGTRKGTVDKANCEGLL